MTDKQVKTLCDTVLWVLAAAVLIWRPELILWVAFLAIILT